MVNYLSLNTYQQVTYICENIQLIIAVIGIIGNILVFIVFSRPNLKKYSYSFYCRAMAIADIGLFACILKNWTAYVLDANLDIVFPFFCSTSIFLLYLSGEQSVLILTFLTADRMLSIVYSNRFNFIKKRWFHWSIVIVGLVFNTSLNSLPVIYDRIIEINQTNTSTETIIACYLSPEIDFKQIWIILAFFIVNIVITNFFNIKVIRFMVSSSRNVNRNSSNNLSHSSARDRKFAISSIGLNISSIVLKLPFIIAHLGINNMVIDFDEFVAIQTVVLTFGIIHNGFSFIINFFVNSIFYDEFLALIGIKKQHLNSTPKISAINNVNIKT